MTTPGDLLILVAVAYAIAWVGPPLLRIWWEMRHYEERIDEDDRLMIGNGEPSPLGLIAQAGVKPATYLTV